MEMRDCLIFIWRANTTDNLWLINSDVNNLPNYLHICTQIYKLKSSIKPDFHKDRRDESKVHKRFRYKKSL